MSLHRTPDTDEQMRCTGLHVQVLLLEYETFPQARARLQHSIRELEMGHIFSFPTPPFPESLFFPFRTRAPPSVFSLSEAGHAFFRLLGSHPPCLHS